MTDQETTREYFNRIALPFARNYAARDAFQERRRIWERLIEESLPRLVRGSVCMDMGCGDGTLGRAAAARGVKTVGVDQSDEMLLLASRRSREAQLEQLTQYIQAPLPLPAALMDQYRGRAGLILCSSVLEYIEPYERLLRQFLELLGNKGRLIVSVPNGHSIYRWAERALDRVHSSADSYLRHQRHIFYPEAFKMCLQQLGYATVHEEYFALPFQSMSSKFLGARRGRRLATLYVLVADRA
jgi:SAM-dependent methyltransferase